MSDCRSGVRIIAEASTSRIAKVNSEAVSQRVASLRATVRAGGAQSETDSNVATGSISANPVHEVEEVVVEENL